MRPASARFADHLRRSHTVAVEVEVLHQGQPVATLDTVHDGAVTLDASAQVRGRLDLALVDPTGDLIPRTPEDRLAPYGSELRVSRGIVFPDGTRELVSLGVFIIQDVEVDTHQVIRVAAMDRAQRIIDARFEEPHQVAQGTNYAAAILATLQEAWPQIPHDFAATTRTTPMLAAEEAGDRWDFCREMATAIAMDLFFDGSGVCVLRPVVQETTPVVELVEGDGGVLVEATRRWTRQGAFNRVIATGEATSEAEDGTPPPRGVATDDNPHSPTYFFGAFGRVPRFYFSPFITTDQQAQDAAQAILARELGTTQQVNFGAVVDPRLEPGDVVRIRRQESGIDEDHVIESLTIPLTADQAMTGTTKATQVFA